MKRVSPRRRLATIAVLLAAVAAAIAIGAWENSTAPARVAIRQSLFVQSNGAIPDDALQAGTRPPDHAVAASFY